MAIDPKADDQSHIAALAQRLLHGEFGDLSRRDQRVIATMTRRQPATRNIHRALEEKVTFGDRLADCVDQFGGSRTGGTAHGEQHDDPR